MTFSPKVETALRAVCPRCPLGHDLLLLSGEWWHPPDTMTSAKCDASDLRAALPAEPPTPAADRTELPEGGVPGGHC